MSLATRRQAVADALTTALAGVGYRIYPYRPDPFAIGSGWLIVATADVEELTLAEVARITFTVVIALGTDDLAAEQEMDRIGGQLLTAITANGRGASFVPLTLTLDGSEIYCLAGTLITEVG